jgi:hypothetical protein
VFAQGCTDALACNYDANAAINDGSCTYPGCTDPTACNYNATAGCDDGSCAASGCTDANACNYDSNAACDDGSCAYLDGEIAGAQLVFTLQEDVFEFPCDQGCVYQWSVSDIAGTSDAAGIILGAGDDCEATIAWGNYTGIAELQLQVSCDNGCNAEFEYPVQIDTGIEEAMIGQLSVYPNPTTDGFTVQLSSAFLGGTLTVHNALGQVIYTGTSNQPQQTIDSKTWEAGVYLMHIQQDEHTAHAILVKQ